MAGDRQYILKTVDGEEYGPADQETLMRWAENGRITPYCMVRSTLIARWEKAVDIPFLRDLLMTQMAEEQEKEMSRWDRLKQRATMRAPEDKDSSGLHGSRPEDFERAPLYLRFFACVFDLVVAVLIGVCVYFAYAFAYSSAGLEATWGVLPRVLHLLPCGDALLCPERRGQRPDSGAALLGDHPDQASGRIVLAGPRVCLPAVSPSRSRSSPRWQPTWRPRNAPSKRF